MCSFFCEEGVAENVPHAAGKGCGSLFVDWPLHFQGNKADAMTVDSGLLFQYSQDPYNLKPVAAEIYGTPESESSLGTQQAGDPDFGPEPCGARSGQVCGSVSCIRDRMCWIFWARQPRCCNC